MSNIEQDTRFIVNNNLINKGWILDIRDIQTKMSFLNQISLRIVNNEFTQEK